MTENSESMPDRTNQGDFPEEISLDMVRNSKFDVSESEKRKTFNNTLAGVLSIIILSVFGAVILWHMAAISVINWNLLDQTTDVDTIEKILDKSSSIINDTAKSLYTVIVPIASSMLSFYFATTVNKDFSD